MFAVIHQDKHFIAADKPAGWLSVPSRLADQDERRCLGTELQKSLGQQIFPVHRLDVEVTGLILFALNSAAHRTACAWFGGRTVHKRYEALSEGGPPAAEAPAHFEWQSRLLRGKRRAYESPVGKDARTEAVWLGSRDIGGAALQAWDLVPHTGRPHQLRYELARHGQPIWGDTLYGATGSGPAGGGIGLRSVLLDFSACAGRLELGLPSELRARGLQEAPA